jgi:endonuclease/exonuclease/phosphatase family metal-dependent hydrolase
VRVATFNILHGRSLIDGEVDIPRFAEAVSALDADVLALQEVDRNQPRSANADLTAVAAEAMGAADQLFVAALSGSPGATWVAATGEEQPDETAYGIALLSRLAVTSWEVVRLRSPGMKVPMWFKGRRKPELVSDEPRVAVAARIGTPSGPLTVINTHVSFIRWWGRHQLRRVMDAVAAEQRLLLMGDLNMAPAAARRVTGLRELASGPTFPAQNPLVQLDHVLARGEVGRVRSAQIRPMPLSDHCALVVDLE